MNKGDIVQITDKDHHWFPCLVIVDEVKPWGIQGYVTIPAKGNAYIRLTTEAYEPVGQALVYSE